MDEVQSPPAHRSTPDDDDEHFDEHLDEGSDNTTAEAERRKYQRGGRRKSEKGERDSRLPPVPKPTTPEDEPAKGETLEEFNNRLRGEISASRRPKQNGATHEEPEQQQEPELGQGMEQELELEPQTNGHYANHEKNLREQYAEDSDTVCDKCHQKPVKTTAAAIPARQETPFETGIRAFNVKRAAASGGRPIGVRATSGSEKGKKSAAKSKKKKKKARKVESSSEDESEEDDGEEKRKPMSIKLELNLMIEIFLKAKIKGDVTITFLE